MSTPEDMAACVHRDASGHPLIHAAPGAAVNATIRDSPQYQPRGASIVWTEQAHKALLPLVAVLIVALAVNALVMGLNMSRQRTIETSLRDDQVSQDLRKYETQQLRVQSALNAELQKLILQQGCKR